MIDITAVYTILQVLQLLAIFSNLERPHQAGYLARERHFRYLAAGAAKPKPPLVATIG